MNRSRCKYNLTASARRFDRYVSKALIGLIVGGLSGAAIEVLYAALQTLLEPQFENARLAAFAGSLPEMLIEGVSFGLFTGLIVGLFAARYAEHKV